VANDIWYLNTDLDLTSADDLTELAAAFEAAGLMALHVTQREDGLWYATFEMNEQHTEPELTIAGPLAVVEALTPPLRSAWARCTRREFNIGYECGAEPWPFTQGVSAELLGRMAAAGASLRLTLYPDRRAPEEAPQQSSTS
jgi:hypothetical protein